MAAVSDARSAAGKGGRGLRALTSYGGKGNQLETSTCKSPFTAVAGRLDCLVHFMFWVCR